MRTFEELQDLFERANAILLNYDRKLFTTDVSEPSICGALMLHLHDLMNEDGSYDGYYTDIEYNRNVGNPRCHKEVITQSTGEIRKIKCDLLIHSRGENICQDNLLALEMKKSSRRKNEKQSDRDRLIALTSNSYGQHLQSEMALPMYVCGYIMGVYYEIDLSTNRCWIEYFQNGKSMTVYEISLSTGDRQNLKKLPWQQ